MEKELNRGDTHPEAPGSSATEPPRLELAHVLFMDLVAFSTMPMEEQRQSLHNLQEIVRQSPQLRAGDRDSGTIRLPTGDGMALVFFGDPIACVQCALDVSARLKDGPLKLRMGVNTGPVYRVADINTNLNAAGGGINTAQRIMDAGDAGHILVSKSTADVLLQFSEWAGRLHDLGEHPVKHGVTLRFYNLCTTELGNPALPSRFRAEHQRTANLRRRRIVAAVAGTVIIILGLAVASRTFVSKRRRSVAVMGFRNITGRHEADWVSTDVAEGLRTQLASTGKLRTISGEESAEMWKDLGLTQLDSMGRSTLARLNNRGADLVIVGSYTDLPDGRIHLNLVIQDTGQGETTDSLIADGTEAEITQLIAQTGARLRGKMGLGTIPPEKERQLALSQPSSEAARFYSEGLTQLRAYEPVQARAFLERAVIVDPAYPFAHSALAEAWLVLGYDQKAREEAGKAFELSNGLSLEDHMSIEARYRGIATEWPAAITGYQQLYKYSQKDLDYGLKLAEAQRSGGKGKDALATLTGLRRLPKPEGQDPRIDLEEAETLASLGDLKRGLTVAASAVRSAKSTGARLLESRALVWSCFSFWKLGEMEEGKQACGEARTIATELEDKLGAARAANNLANIASDQGDLDSARRLFEQALALGREIGAQRDVSGALNNIGIVLSAQGQLAEAKQRYEEALKIQQEIGFKSEIPNTLQDIADLLHQQGDLAGARSIFEQAISAAHESGNEGAEGGAKANLGMVLFDQGDLAAAERNYRDALATERKLGEKSNTASILDSLADLLVVRGNLQGAEQSYTEALSIQQALGAKGAVATSRMGLATVALERNDPAQAETSVRASVEVFHSEKDSADETMARVVLVRSLLAQNRLSDAQKEMNPAIALVKNESQGNVRYSVLIVAERLRATLDGKSNASRAIDSLRKIARDAEKAGMPGFGIEARLAIGEIEIEGGRKAPGRAELDVVQKEAQARGFSLIAQKAVDSAR
jgi:tetratricopeptide (TPR) repeat protein/class 3 adenylate cyclase